MKEDATEPLKRFQPKREFFIGIDSDGCAFDTMEIKHKECFIPNIIKYWQLQSISKYVREAAEFVNLYSKWRGINRWPALIKVFDLLAEWDDVQKRKAVVPAAQPLRDWIGRETRLGNPALASEIKQNNDPILKQGLDWSEAVNRSITEMVEGIPPFPYMQESLDKMASLADAFVISQTPTEALCREWEEHDIAKYVEVIAGQEMGTKTEHIAFAAGGKYPAEKILMIGDAPGDMQAAKSNEALFFPINPGKEEISWKRFYEEALDKFIEGTYIGSYQEKLIREFEEYLPETPPWEM